MTEPLRVGRVLAVLDALAPPDLAEAWDHVGLQVGSVDQAVERILVTLEMSDALAARLAAGPPTLVVSHHPLLFRALEAVRADRPTGRYVAALLRAGASLVACHTNWDKAPGGTDDALAAAIGLGAPLPLVGASRPLYRLSAVVPEESLDEVREALAAAGAGESTLYRRASFSVHGESTFEPKAGAHPAFGAVGGLSVRSEHRLEMVVTEENLAAARRALLAAHPYEEPAYGVDRLEGGAAFGGLGRIGRWGGEPTLLGLAAAVRASLGAGGARVAGSRSRPVRRVASVGGSGRSLLTVAAAAGADAVVTADVGHHDARLAEELGIGVVDIGHRESEQPGVRALCARLAERLSAQGLATAVEFVPVEPAFDWQVSEGGGKVRLRIETDGASRGNPGEAAGAAVLFDSEGRQVARVGRYLGRTTNNVAEYTGLLAGIELAAELGATEIEVRADSELMVRQLNGIYRVKNPGLQALYADAVKRLAGFASYRIVHVPRERNRAADQAANDAVDRRASYVERDGV